MIAHNYVTDVSVLKGYASDEMLSVYLAVPQVTTDYGAATMSRDFADGIRLWITEFNTMYLLRPLYMEYLYVEFVCKCIYVYFTYILDGAGMRTCGARRRTRRLQRLRHS